MFHAVNVFASKGSRRESALNRAKWQRTNKTQSCIGVKVPPWALSVPVLYFRIEMTHQLPLSLVLVFQVYDHAHDSCQRNPFAQVQVDFPVHRVIFKPKGTMANQDAGWADVDAQRAADQPLSAEILQLHLIFCELRYKKSNKSVLICVSETFWILKSFSSWPPKRLLWRWLL